MNTHTGPITTSVSRASFSFWNKDQITSISVKKVTEPKSFEKAGALHKDGLYSPSLGPVKRFESCTTCGLTDIACPGHYGHIELSVPVYHPMLVQTMYQILSKCCIECYHFRLSKTMMNLLMAQIEALNCGFDHLIEELDDIAKDMCRDKWTENDPYLHIILSKKLIERVQEEKEKDPELDCSNRPQQRSIVERLSKLFRTFINGQLIKPSKVCQECSAKRTPISLHQQSVLVIGSGSSKALGDIDPESKSSRPRGKKKRKYGKKSINSELKYLHTDERKFLTPIGAREIFRRLWKNEKHIMSTIFRFLGADSDFDNPGEDPAKPATVEQEDDAIDDPKQALKKEKMFQPVDIFFVDTLLVPPGKFRPPMSQRGYSFEGPRTAALGNVMKQSVIVQDCIDRMVSEPDEIEAERLQPKLQSHWKDLQTAVNCLYDNEMDKYGKNKYPGLKQLIDKKEGLFRKNMMGKRVNFAARSVISPDPNILVDQIGVPLVFAQKLTYPQPVTSWNIGQLKEAILNGPDRYPGATSIVYDDGFTVCLKKESTRQAIAARLSCYPRSNRNKQDTHRATIVNRHLLTGDVLLFNRQPTLHKPSIMAFRARVLPNEKGFRLHYANCKSFNADFDGDEMNAHLPQSELARSEAYNIASVNYQYLVPKDGSPLGGLIQDHVVAVCILTRRDQFFDNERYHQLVYCALSFLEKPVKIEEPVILKPTQLWTGKQVITTIIKNCIPEGKLPPTLDIKSKIGPKILNIKPKDEKMSDCHVYIRKGELLLGFMDKSNVGATPYGLIHTCYELYGGETSSNLMSAFARLSTLYLQLYEGFTLGIADILVEDDADQDRYQSIIRSLSVGPGSAKEALGVTEDISEEKLEEKLRDAHSDRNPLPMKKLDAAMKKRTDEIASEISGRCLPEGLIRRFPDNNLQMMIQSGAKGGTVNALQISCLLGQIELEGRRVPLSMSGRSLPSFKPYDTSPKAGGFVSGRFLTGIQPQEFFFHCMAGREGLIDTAVKTSRSGYLQRCLIKHLEGLTVHYDQTVRDSCGSVIQFLYGEDGLDITKCQMLKSKAFPLLVENSDIVRASDDELALLYKNKDQYEPEIINRLNDIQAWLAKNNRTDRAGKVRGSGFLDFFEEVIAQWREKGGCDIQETINSDTSITEVGEDVDTSKESVTPTPSSQQQEMKYRPMTIGSQHHDSVFQAWYSLSFKEKRKYNKFWENCPDPVISIMNPASHYGAVPEKLDEILEEFVARSPKLIANPEMMIAGCQSNFEAMVAYQANPELSKSILASCNELSKNSPVRPLLTKHEFFDICYNLYMKMLAQPGEAVGLLAAQSIGEPSTQMTLNTFHFAGRGEMNVTLGIPRLREILMTASAKIGTPSMDLPLLANMRDEFGNELSEEATEEQAKRVRLALNAVRLSDVLEYVDIVEQVVDAPATMGAMIKGKAAEPVRRKGVKRSKSGGHNHSESRRSVHYELTFNILPSKYYKHEFKTTSSKVMKFIEGTFVSQLTESMMKRQRRLASADYLFDEGGKKLNLKERQAKVSGASQAQGAENDPEEQDLDDYNAKESAKEKVNKEDESSSDDDDDGEGDNTTQRLKNRRNQDLDYDEPEDDDLDVGDVEATTAEAEENDDEILADDEAPNMVGINSKGEEVAEASKSAKDPSSKSRDNKHGTSAVGEDNDEAGVEVKQEPYDDDDADNTEFAGKTVELAAFEDGTNTRSGFPSPMGGRNEEGNETILEPVKKKKRRAKSTDEAAAAAGSSPKASSGRKALPLDEATILQRTETVKQIPWVTDYEFDIRHERWCKLKVSIPLSTTRLDMSALIESEARRTFIHRVGNIQRALIVKDVHAKSRGSKCDKMIKTEGVSLLSLVRFNHILDLNAIYSNDIHAIANTYGIEAASQAIRREMANVFAVYGIEVDSRHLSLIADYMTYNGTIRGMNRMSMEASASPFQQMSYESTIRYLKLATILGLYDDIKSPSAALVFGRPTRGGTGIFGLMSAPPAQSAQSAARRREQANPPA